MHHIKKLAAAVVCGLALAACGGGDDGNTSSNSSSGSSGSASGAGGSGTGIVATPKYAVTPGVSGTGGAISPAAAVSVTSGATTSFTLSPDSGYTVAQVGGTCGGTLNGATYTTQAIAANCSVVASFKPITYRVTASVNGSGGAISSSAAPVSVNSGSVTSFTLTPSAGYTATVGGTCGGQLTGATYTTQAITADCTVVASFTSTGASVSSGSYAACFTPKDTTVTYWMRITSSDGDSARVKVSYGPGIYNNYPASVSAFYTDLATVYTYAPLRSVGLAAGYDSFTETVFNDGSTRTCLDKNIYDRPENGTKELKPGEFTDILNTYTVLCSDGTEQYTYPQRSTFVGFEKITLAGKVFDNVCHFKIQDLPSEDNPFTDYSVDDIWVAPGYDMIQGVSKDSISQYDGDF